MSKFAHLLTGVLSTLGMGAPKAPALPVPAEVPAQPALTENNDTGATIAIGADAAGQRILPSSKKRKVGDVLGGLGASSGLNV